MSKKEDKIIQKALGKMLGLIGAISVFVPLAVYLIGQCRLNGAADIIHSFSKPDFKLCLLNMFMLLIGLFGLFGRMLLICFAGEKHKKAAIRFYDSVEHSGRIRIKNPKVRRVLDFIAGIAGLSFSVILLFEIIM